MSVGGFSLIELLITVAIIGVLASGAMALTELVVKRTREQELRNALHEIRGAIDAYKQAADTQRVKKGIDETGYPKTLEVLTGGVVASNDAKGGKIYFLRRLPRDPLADVSAPAAQTWGLRSYESDPDHPKPGKDIFDVYSLSDKTGLNGIPYRQW
jgi:general secretion pathway protein G